MGKIQLQALVFLTAGTLVSAPAFAAPATVAPKTPQAAPSIKPAWAMRSTLSERANPNAYFDANEELRNKTLPEKFFDKKTDKVTCGIRQDYELRQMRFEERRNSGLTKVEDERQHNNQMSDFSKDALMRVGKSHIKAMEQRMKVLGDSIDGAREPVAVALLAASLYTGRTLNFKAIGMRWEGRSDAKDKNASLAMLLPGVKGAVGYSRDEKVSGKVSANVLPNISAEVDTAEKGRVSLQYGVSF